MAEDFTEEGDIAKEQDIMDDDEAYIQEFIPVTEEEMESILSKIKIIEKIK